MSETDLHPEALRYDDRQATETLFLFLFFLLEEHAATLGDDILAEAGAGGRVGRVDSEALAILALLAGLSLLFVHGFHGGISIYRF